jgi:hypothetical protein
MPESEPESTESAADYGASTRESFANFDPATSSWRTSQRSFFEEWSEFSETWPRAGMTRSGKAYELPTLARRTDESESGLWPTPQAFDSKASESFTPGSTWDRNKPDHTLAMAAQMYPTPRVCAGLRSSGMNRTEFYRKFWPTPRAIDGRPKGNGPRPNTLTGAINYVDGKRIGTLNPTWVEWLMGYPPGWTALEDSATPSSRKSRSSSRGKSGSSKSDV